MFLAKIKSYFNSGFFNFDFNKKTYKGKQLNIKGFLTNFKESDALGFRIFHKSDLYFIPLENEKIDDLDKDEILITNGHVKISLTKKEIKIEGNVSIEGDLKISGKFECEGDGEFKGSLKSEYKNVSLKGHKHGGMPLIGNSAMGPVQIQGDTMGDL